MAGKWYGTIYLGDESNETVKGTAAAESIRGEGGADKLGGGGGNDSIEGGSGSDTLRGGAGDDILYGFSSYGRDFGGGVDHLFGDGGDDTVSLTAPLAAGFSLDGGVGKRDTAQIVFGSFQGSVTAEPIAFALNVKGSVLKVAALATVSVKNFERLDFSGDMGADKVTGGALDDIISGREGDDVLKGLGGDDVLDGGTGKQDLDGGAGLDTASFDLSAATERLVVKTGAKVLLGSRGVLKSIEKFGYIHTGSGADSITMGNYGGGTAYAGDGADKLAGGKGDDRLYGNAGSDTILGGGGNDELDADFVSVDATPAPAANDTLRGGAGNDRLWGGDGADKLFGDGGNDSVGWSTNGLIDTTFDSFDGGAGIDTFTANLSKTSLTKIEFALQSSGAAALKLNGSIVAKAVAVEALDLTDFGTTASVIFTGGAHDDHLFADRGNAVVKTFGGADSVSVGSGSDTVDTGAGDDYASAMADGKDAIKTGAGNDTLTIQTFSVYGSTGLSPSTYDLGAGGGDRVDISEGPTADFAFDGTTINLGGTKIATVLNYEYLTFHGSDRSTTFNGTRHDDSIDMGSGEDTGNGGAGDDTLSGGYGADTLNGGQGNDTVSGGDGNDKMDGGTGSDTIVFSDWGATGLDIVLKGHANSTVAVGQYQKDTFKNFESVSGSQAADTITGDKGANVLNGLGGGDMLWGKGGSDTFVFSAILDADHNVDVIKDFSAKDDSIKLEGSVFGKLTTAGKDNHLAEAAFKDLGDKGAKLDAGDRILYNHKTGDLWFDADGSGVTKAVRLAHLDAGNKGFADLSPADFIVKYIEPIMS